MLNKLINLGYPKRECEELLKVSKDINKDYELLKENFPIQYLIGYTDFYGNKIIVNDKVLIPRFETELLVEKTINYCKKIFNNTVSILDLCTGSGAIAITLDKELNSITTASDISSDAIKIAKKNNDINNTHVKFINSDIFSNINDKFDVIISNPPYISYDEIVDESVKKYEPHLALYAKNNGLYFYEEILKDIKLHLNDNYLIAFEIGYTQSNDIVNIINKYFDNIYIKIEKDYSNKDRFIFIMNKNIQK